MQLKQICARLLALTLALATLAGCGGQTGSGRGDPPSGKTPPPVTTSTPTTTPEPTPDAPATPTPTPSDYVAWGPTQVVEHIFFHPVIAYPEVAFSSSQAKGLDDWMVTVNEYNKILASLYEKNYIIVNMNDVWKEETNAAGELRMVRQTLMLPPGKKPLIISFDDVNYYPYMLVQGFTHKLIIGDDGDIWAYGLDPATGEEIISKDLDATTILDTFVEEHPDFSLNGAKGCFSLTGYCGILGYRTQTDRDITDPAQLEIFEANRQKEIEAVKPIIQKLKDTGWYFGSHTWGHISLATKGMDTVKNDTQRWADEVGTLVGPTSILFYPHGSRPDGDNDVSQTGPIFQYLHAQGFRMFASVGIESYSKIKTDISAVICDRLHPDGTTLRWAQKRYLQFYNAKDIMDVDVRPDLGYKWE